MQSFSYYCPTKVLFGKDSEQQVAQQVREFGGSRVFVVYGGGSVVRSGLLGRVQSALDGANLPCRMLGGVQPNPRLGLARQGVQEALSFGADFILAVGGGSVIDTAKAIAHGVAEPSVDIWDYWEGARTVQKSLPVGVILTISAAGSEMSDSSVLTNEETGVKRGLSTPFNRPRFAVMNPELTYTLPAYQVACGIVDIMMHTLDRYFTPTKGNQLTDAFAEALLRTVIANGRIAMQDSHDYEAMSELMWCGSVSHNGLTGLGAAVDFVPHKLGHELSGKFDVAHGASLAVMWGAWATYSWREHPERFVQFAREVWGIQSGSEQERAEAAIRETVQYFQSLGMPTDFTSLGIGVQPDEVLWGMADKATRGDAMRLGSFKPVNKEAAFAIYQLANQ